MKCYPLPVSLRDLLGGRKVESDRLEFKEGWNPPAILRTVCAFANDFHNYGGGYILIGVGQRDGQAVAPSQGVPDKQLDNIQQELLQYCNLIQPPYFPILGIEPLGNSQSVVVLWCPGGQTRPYKVPKDVTAKNKDYAYYIRHYANSVIAKNGELQELIRLTATVPFDDRMNHQAELDDLKMQLIRSYLREVKSGLYATAGKLPFADLCRQLAIVDGGDEFLKPRNVGLLFFCEAPERFFPYACIEVVHFPQGPAGDRIEERVFKGPLDHQLRSALRHLQSDVVRERIDKRPDRAEAKHIFNYPYGALEEALVNAVYHRGYDQREPIEVRVNPDRIEIVSYPGPDPSIRREALNGKRIVARRYRNRRIGEFLKELDLTEGRATGIPKIWQAMRENGSPPPRIETDDERTYFLIELPIHPAFRAAQVAAQVEAQVAAQVVLNDLERRILELLRDGPRSVQAIAAALGSSTVGGNLKKVLGRLDDLGLVGLTIPDKPKSSRQQRKLTERGRDSVASDLPRPPD